MMKFLVVQGAERHGEFIAHLASQSARLREPDVMRL
jgi:hypothetical protein